MRQRPALKTERLVLRPFEMSDAAEVKRLAGERTIADTTVNIPHPYEDGMAEDWIAKQQDIFEQGTGVDFAITLKSEASLVGAMSLMGMVKGHQAKLGNESFSLLGDWHRAFLIFKNLNQRLPVGRHIHAEAEGLQIGIQKGFFCGGGNGLLHCIGRDRNRF